MVDITQQELVRVDVIAKLFGVTARRIQQLTQDGVLPTINDPGSKVKRACYDLYPTIQRYVEYLNGKAKGKIQDTDSEVKLKEQKLKAEVRLKESQAELHTLKTEIAAGKYLSLDEIKLDYGRFLTVLKKTVLAIPGRVVKMLGMTVDPVQAREIENDLNEELTNALIQFVNAARVDEEK